MTTILELVSKIIEEGFKISTIIGAIVLWRKHQSSKKLMRYIKSIAKAVDADCVEKNESLLSTVRSLLTWFSAEKSSAQRVDAFIPTGLITYLRRTKMKKKLLSRKFLMAVLSAALVVCNDGLNLGLDNETIIAFGSIVVGWIVAEAGTDIAQAKSNGVSAYDAKALDLTRKDSEDAVYTASYQYNGSASASSDQKMA